MDRKDKHKRPHTKEHTLELSDVLFGEPASSISSESICWRMYSVINKKFGTRFTLKIGSEDGKFFFCMKQK